MKLGAILLGSCLIIARLAVAAPAGDARFSQTLTAVEQKELGIARLSSDQVAVLDALVRRDSARATSNSEKSSPNFSQRLTADERTNAGLTQLTPAEVVRVDTRVAEFGAAGVARALLAPPTYISRARIISPSEKKEEREIHGSYSISYGVGSGGYSEKSGSMVLRMDDPAHNLSISVGYSETHVKGGSGYYRDDLRYARPPDLLSPLP